MKSKISIIILLMAGLLLLTVCQQNQGMPSVSTVPDGYKVDSSLYLADGFGIYAFVENEAMDYNTINAEICNGNAKEVNEQYENAGNSGENPEEYAAIQNLLGITEVYLGEYEKAYESFNKTIAYVEEKNLPEKNKILAVLYNNAGTVTANLSRHAQIDSQLEKASELSEDPYMGLVIAVNQAGRVKAAASVKEYGDMLLQSKEFIEEEQKLEDSPDFVLFTSVRNMSVAYMITGQEEKAIEVLDEYIPLVPDAEEYYLLKAALLGQRGHCYFLLLEYQMAIGDLLEAIDMAKQTVDKKSRALAYEYMRLGVSYLDSGDAEAALYYSEEAIPGYEEATPQSKETLYYNLGCACWDLQEYEEAKRYLLLAYLNKEMVIEDVGYALEADYGQEIEDGLYIIYEMEDTSAAFSEWLEKELKHVETAVEKK